MSMTREEAMKLLSYGDWWNHLEECLSTEEMQQLDDALFVVEKALRPVSREQVEKMKKEPVEGEYDELYAPTYKCPECGFENIGRGNFCRNCGCLHTDEAVEIRLKELEALHGEKESD